MPPAPLDIQWLRDRLPVHGLGGTLLYEPTIASTNTVAMELVHQHYPAGTVVVTDTQPEGRGRQGRTWITLPQQQILLSVILPLPFLPHWLVMAAALSARDALIDTIVPIERATIKWPNDLLVDEKKVAGILIETKTQASGQLITVVGLGMNVNGTLAHWPEIAATAQTLADASSLADGSELLREPIILRFLAALGLRYTQLVAGHTSEATTLALWRQWRATLAYIGATMTVHQGSVRLQGIAEDVAPDGSLLLRLDDGTLQAITWGDVLVGSHSR